MSDRFDDEARELLDRITEPGRHKSEVDARRLAVALCDAHAEGERSTRPLLFYVLRRAAKSTGSCEPPASSLAEFEEDLDQETYRAARAFLEWCASGGHTFGHNLPDVHALFERETF